MRLFGKAVKKRSPYHRKSDEQIDKEQTRKEKQWAREKLLDKAKTNPELENQYISQLMGIEIKPEDPIEKQRREITSKVIGLALEKIKNDPTLTERFVDSQVEKIIGETPAAGGEEGEPGESAVRQVLDDLDTFDELRERVGGKGMLGGLITSDVIKTAIETVGSILQQRGGGVIAPPEETVIVQVNGQVKRITVSEFKRLEQQGLVKPIAALAPPTAPPKSPEEKSADISQFLSLVDLDTLILKLEYEPEAYVLELQSEVEVGDTKAQFIWGALSKMSIDEIVEKVTPYKENEKLKSYIGKLLSDEGKEWLTKVIDLVRGIEGT